MAKHRRSEAWWANHPEVLRCTAHYKSTGERCGVTAAPGTNVCNQHGALIPAVQAAAAQRIGMSVDDAVKRLHAMLDDESVEAREKIKILHDLLDRGGLGATQKHLVGVGTLDPVERLFADILGDPNALADPTAMQVTALPPPDPAQALLDAAEEGSGRDTWRGRENGADVVVGEVVDGTPAHTVVGEMPKTPKHIREALERLI